MDNTALEIVIAVLWTLGIAVLPVLSVFIGGLTAVYRFGVRAAPKGESTFLRSDDPTKFISESAKKGFFTILGGILVGIVLAVICIIFAVNAWVAVAA